MNKFETPKWYLELNQEKEKLLREIKEKENKLKKETPGSSLYDHLTNLLYNRKKDLNYYQEKIDNHLSQENQVNKNQLNQNNDQSFVEPKRNSIQIDNYLFSNNSFISLILFFAMISLIGIFICLIISTSQQGRIVNQNKKLVCITTETTKMAIYGDSYRTDLVKCLEK